MATARPKSVTGQLVRQEMARRAMAMSRSQPDAQGIGEDPYGALTMQAAIGVARVESRLNDLIALMGEAGGVAPPQPRRSRDHLRLLPSDDKDASAG